ADPARTSAYRSLGNLYHQLYAEQGQPQFQSIYIAAYKKYVGRLREQQQIVLLPQVVTDAVFAPQADICAFAGQMLNPTGLVDLRLFFNPETGVERYAKANAMEKGETGISYSGFVE